jgi:hypothetical protein
MKRQTCVVLSSIHLLTLAICTYVAAIDITSILVSGWICSITGFAAGISALRCKRLLLAIVGFLTPCIAVILFNIEVAFLHLGPRRAAFPFTVVFIVNQVVGTIIVLVHLNIFIGPEGASAKQVTLKTLMIAMVSFSLFFAMARHLLERQHDWLMHLALGLLGLTFVGLTVTLFAAIGKSNAAKIDT